jgi:hypothetical protein
MKTAAFLLSIILLASGICFAQTSAFTYQGKLASSGTSANGDFQFEFKLFDSDIAGNQVGTTQTVVASVQNGVFTTSLDFGAASFPAECGRNVIALKQTSRGLSLGHTAQFLESPLVQRFIKMSSGEKESIKR